MLKLEQAQASVYILRDLDFIDYTYTLPKYAKSLHLVIVCIFKYEICSSFTSREMNTQSPLCSFDIFAMNNLFMTVIVNVLLYQKTLNYVDVRVMILAELIVVFIDKFLTIF